MKSPTMGQSEFVCAYILVILTLLYAPYTLLIALSSPPVYLLYLYAFNGVVLLLTWIILIGKVIALPALEHGTNSNNQQVSADY